jgi:hypothetical protein
MIDSVSDRHRAARRIARRARRAMRAHFIEQKVAKTDPYTST